jgi:hypothetical protein
MKLIWCIVAAFFLSGCARLNYAQVPSNTAVILDGTLPAEEAQVKRVVRRPPRMANASVETTGSVEDSDQQLEDMYLSQILKLPPNSPEWLALRTKIEDRRVARNRRENARLTICKNC